jgi:hypothetical protein
VWDYGDGMGSQKGRGVLFPIYAISHSAIFFLLAHIYRKNSLVPVLDEKNSK